MLKKRKGGNQAASEHAVPWSAAAEPSGGRWGAWGWHLSHFAGRPLSSCLAGPSAGPLLHSAAAALWDGPMEPCPDPGPARNHRMQLLNAYSFPPFAWPENNVGGRAEWPTSQQYCWTSCSTLLRSLLSCSSSSNVVAYRFWRSKSMSIE